MYERLPLDEHGLSLARRDHVELPDRATLRRYDVPGPRYTSYPTADRFVEAFDADAFALSLIHI